MSVGFGFSVGDFLAALALVGTVIDALREAGDASKQFNGLIRELTALQITLESVKRLELRHTQIVERCALLQAVSNCQLVIHEFWTTVQRYQPHLQSIAPSYTLKDAWMKIRWAVCKKEDVVKFKADLRSHTGNIELLLTTVQMSTYSLQSHAQDMQQKALANSIEEASFQCMGKLGDISNAVNYNILQSSEIMQSTLHILHSLQNSDGSYGKSPRQVARQQPVFMLDALNREGTFDLDFIRSARSFVAVLKDNLRNIKNGSAKIERGEFSITIRGTNREIDLSQEWHSCFLPGQRVGMSMLFHRPSYRGGACPSCRSICSTLPNMEIDCTMCGLNFLKLEPSSHVIHESPILQNLISRHESGSDVSDDEISYYRRVRVLGALPEPHAVRATAASPPLQGGFSTSSPIQKRTKGCTQLIERYAVCGCVYHRHEVEHTLRCTCLGREENLVLKNISVGYACEEHSIQSSTSPNSPISPPMTPLSPENSIPRPSFSDGVQKQWAGDLPTPPISAPQSLDAEPTQSLPTRQSWKQSQPIRSPRPQSFRKQTGLMTGHINFPISPPISGEENTTIWNRASPLYSSPISIRSKRDERKLSSSLPISIKGVTADRIAPPLLSLPDHDINATNDIGWQWANQRFGK